MSVREYRCKICGHWPEEHSDENGCAGCDAAGYSEQTILHRYEPDELGDSWVQDKTD